MNCKEKLFKQAIVIFDCHDQSFISERETGSWALSPPIFNIFLIILISLRS